MGIPPLGSCRLSSCDIFSAILAHPCSCRVPICIKSLILFSRIHAIFLSSLWPIVNIISGNNFFRAHGVFALVEEEVHFNRYQGSFLTRLKTEYCQNSRSYGAPSLAASTPMFSVLLPLALVPVSCTLLGASLAGSTSRTRCLLRALLVGVISSALVFWEVNSSFLGAQNPNSKSTKNSLLSASKPLPEAFDRPTSVFVGSFTGSPTSIIESLWSGKGLIQERWCCARGWWMMAVLTRDTWNLVLLLFLQYPTLWAYARNIHTQVHTQHTHKTLNS